MKTILFVLVFIFLVFHSFQESNFVFHNPEDIYGKKPCFWLRHYLDDPALDSFYIYKFCV